MTSTDKDRVVPVEVGEPATPAEALRRALEMATQLRDAMIGQHNAAGHVLAVHTQGEDCSWCVRAADECDGSYACLDWKAWQAQYEAALCIPFAALIGRWADELDAARSTDPGPAPTTSEEAAELRRLRGVETTLRVFAGRHADLSEFGDVVVTGYLEGFRDGSQKLARCVLSALDGGPAEDPLSVPPGTEQPEYVVDSCLSCNGPLVRRRGRLLHQATGERTCPPPGTEPGHAE